MCGCSGRSSTLYWCCRRRNIRLVGGLADWPSLLVIGHGEVGERDAGKSSVGLPMSNSGPVVESIQVAIASPATKLSVVVIGSLPGSIVQYVSAGSWRWVKASRRFAVGGPGSTTRGIEGKGVA